MNVSGNLIECCLACWDEKAAKQAELVGQDPEETPDIWAPCCIDFRHVISVRQVVEDPAESWLHFEGYCWRVDLPYKTALELFKKIKQ